MSHPSDRLRSLRSFEELTAYLEDGLGWPLQNYTFDELTFTYEPAELGLKDEDAAKVKRIHQLRPLTTGQPWGIFFVEFDKKRLPVVVLRRVLRHLVMKKRASPNLAEAKRWQPRDLLFISAWGDEEKREMTFAHFVDHPELGLAELRVLGWDDDDTPLHMDYVAQRLGEKLRWRDEFERSPEAWRKQWSEAFILRHRHVIRTSEELADELAVLARRLRSRIRTILRSEDGFGEIRKLQRAFQTGLIHDLDDDGFADMFAQTVTYGLFSVSVRRTFPGEGTAVTKDDVPNLIFTSPFLKEMLGVFLGIKSRKGAIDFDELGVSDVTDLLTSPDTHMEVVLADFNNKTRGEDPVIHFYEHFLSAYNKQLKIQRGVFYTPQPVVSYIVRSVHELLQTEFGLEDGLASTVTWGEMIARSRRREEADRSATAKNPPPHVGGYGELKLPPLTDEPGEKRTISPDEPFVQILDPATGTATFLVEVIDVIHRTLAAKWKQQRLTDAQQRAAWNEYVPQHLLPRLHAFELMMAPYAIAHMKIGLKLAETGYRFGTEERARIYLTNALEPKVKQLPQIGFDALAHEAAAVNEIKWYKRFTVVIGNPPYSILSQNLTEASRAIVDVYKSVQGIPIKERGALQFEKLLQDDYVKFLRLSEIQIENTGVGVNGLITNHSFVDNPTMRGVRDHLMATFPSLSVLDLHGNSLKGERCPDGSDDRNVFDIKQGVAILIGLRGGPTHNCSVRHSDLWGERSSKYSFLASQSVASTPLTPVRPSHPYFLFTSQDESLVQEFQSFPALSEVMPQYSAGVITARDNLAIDESEPALLERAEIFRRSTASDESLCEQLDISLKKGWDISTARKRLREEKNIHRFVQPIVYRVFDTRRIFYHPSIVWGMAFPTMKHMLAGKNIGIITVRRVPSNADCSYFFVSRSLISNGAIRMDNQSVDTMFPLYLTADKDGHQGQFDYGGKCNFGGDFIRRLATMLGLSVTHKTSLPAGLTPEDIFHYAYAVFHSPGYRSRYAEFLKIDFPRLPLTGNLELFRALARLGGELTALHLLESPKLAQPITEFIGGRHPEVEKISWSRHTVWVDKAQTTGFRGVREDVWNFHIGGYQVCEKWLKDRKGRELTQDDLAHYQKIVVALSETIRLMKEIDEVIENHGGWPLG
ncbi:MAG: adenine specific DNA methyltransferase [Limisphaerales bacterium]|nr:MAG: adenine specific DNA methyltransferase [Limisphaerales bacterium]TXT49150.1 MAG: adenine specific DNA methyltransferase [Limisphaerales bacterium]